MGPFRHYLQHHLNPLHLYCRLRTMGMGRILANRLCTMYERHLYPCSWTGRAGKPAV